VAPFTANTITLSGGAAIQYDEGLNGEGTGYVVASWNEI